jgi:hypothetical protein
MKINSISFPFAFSIAILLPTRRRPKMLESSIKSLVEKADNPAKLQILIAFDDDDHESFEYYEKVIAPWCKEKSVSTGIYKTPRLGYTKLHEYYNFLAGEALADWLVVWNDDAEMTSEHWDTEIASYTGRLLLLAFRSNHDHPYALFPVIPKDWYNVCGHVSLHPQNDAWISNVGYILDLYQPIQSYVIHYRPDVTGQGDFDSTANEKVYLEGNPANEQDFNHADQHILRCKDVDRLAWFLKATGNDITRWHDIMQGKLDPWVKLRLNDPKGYTKTILIGQK